MGPGVHAPTDVEFNSSDLAARYLFAVYLKGFAGSNRHFKYTRAPARPAGLPGIVIEICCRVQRFEADRVAGWGSAEARNLVDAAAADFDD